MTVTKRDLDILRAAIRDMTPPIQPVDPDDDWADAARWQPE